MQRAIAPFIKCAAHSDVGLVRTDNQDAWGMEREEGVFLLSDGMGGHAGGGLAARLVVETTPPLVVEALTQGAPESDQVAEALTAAIETVNATVIAEGKKRPGRLNMGATLVLLCLRDERAIVAHKGDSRIYLHRENKLRLLTTDHSLVHLLMVSGDITPAEADTHPARGQITRFIGQREKSALDLSTLPLVTGDRFLLCSDGLNGVVNDDTIAAILTECPTPDSVCQRLVAAACDAGAPDNVTALVVDWIGEAHESEKATQRMERK